MRKAFGFVVTTAVLMVVVFALVGCGPTVPDVVGMRQQDAVRALQDAGYKLGDVSLVATSGVKLGMIAAQNPAAGEKAREGEAVALQIAMSDGTRALVPNVLDLPQVTAEGVGNTLGFENVVVEQYSDDTAKGNVAAQSPEPGAEVSAGSILLIVLSKGPAPEKADVPDVKGKTDADAKAAIEKAGFAAEVYKVYDNTVASGKVITQSPAGGASATLGSKVKYVVSLGKGTGSAKVPSVRGKKEADAVKAIESAGLKARKITQYNASVAKGVVAEQFPAANSTAAKGSEVLILVSLGKEPSSDVAVPSVIGMSPSQATSSLEGQGFSVTVKEIPISGGTGNVVYQFPESGARVAPGSGVLVTVGIAGPEEPGSPDGSMEATTLPAPEDE